MGQKGKVGQKEKVKGQKKPRATENPDSFYDKNPAWSFRKLDDDYCKWGFKDIEDINKIIISKLRDYEGMTWAEIIKTSGGRRKGTNSHFICVDELVKEAQDRWRELKLEENDTVFSLRLTGTQRLFGILDNGVFRIVWFDSNHEICPVSK